MGFHLCCSSSPAAQGTGAFGCTPGLSTNAKMPTLVLQTSRLPLILIWTMYFNGLVIALDASFYCIKGKVLLIYASINVVEYKSLFFL